MIIKQLLVVLISAIFAMVCTHFNLLNNTYIITLMLLFQLVGILFIYLESNLKQSRYEKELLSKLSISKRHNKDNSRQLVSILEALPFPFILIDIYGNIKIANDEVKKFKDEVRDNHTYDNNGFISPIKQFLYDAFIYEKEISTQIYYLDKYYKLLSKPLYVKNKYQGCIVLFQDIDQEVKQEKMQKQFIADASHELKTPIAVIKGMSEILVRPDFDDQQTANEFMQDIYQESLRLEELVKDLLLLSKLSDDRLILKTQYFNASELLIKTLSNFDKFLNNKQLILIQDIDKDLMIEADEAKIKQVFINLIHNAITYTDQGVIKVSLKQTDDNLCFKIKDSGVGISIEDQGLIFERLYRVDQARKRCENGSGLGLAIVKKIVEAHHGQISVQSELAKGSTFKLVLPKTLN